MSGFDLNCLFLFAFFVQGTYVYLLLVSSFVHGDEIIT